MPALYHVRQYRPAFVSGYENAVMRDVPMADMLTAPWFRNFEHEGFDHFSIDPYADGKELIISAHYADGTHFVAGFATAADSELADNWRCSAV